MQDITTTLEDLSPPRGDDISHERKTYIQTLQAQVISNYFSLCIGVLPHLYLRLYLDLKVLHGRHRRILD